MMRCEDIQKELENFFSIDIDDPKKSEIQSHLDECPNCSQALQQLIRLSGALQTWQGIEPSPMMYEKLKTRMKAYESRGRIFINPFARKVALRFAEVVAIVALTLLVSYWFQKPGPEIRDDSATINFYLMEHQGAVAQTVSANISTQPAARMRMNRDDILYYEFIDNPPEFTKPGIIFRGQPSQREVISREAPAISKGNILTLSQARNSVNFDLVAPPRLHPGYILDSIRKIEGRDSLHLLYTNGIDTVSLFEQPLDGKRKLVAQDFREYAVYRSVEPQESGLKGQGGGTILAWSDNAVSFVLIGKADMSQLMDMAQSISATNGRR